MGPGALSETKMVNYDVANARISGFSTFLGGLSLIALMLSITLFSGRARETTSISLVAETLTILLLLAAMILHFSATVCLVSAYTDAATDLERSVRLARRFVGTGVILTFLAVAALMLVAFGSTFQAYFYTLSAVAAALSFIVLRARFGSRR
jgi:hypothetical protein